MLVDHVRDLVAAAAAGLRGTLSGAYVVGSIATGDVRGTASDLDLLLVTSRRLPAAVLTGTGHRLADLAAEGPMRGLEAVLYRQDVLARPSYPLPVELNVNGGAALSRVVETAPQDAFWFLLDVAAARQHALAVIGPRADQLIAPIPDELVRAALAEALVWHQWHGGSTPDVVLNACRAWHWCARHSWLSKTDAGRWAAEQRHAPIVRAALEARLRHSDEPLDATSVQALLVEVRDAVVGAG